MHLLWFLYCGCNLFFCVDHCVDDSSPHLVHITALSGFHQNPIAWLATGAITTPKHVGKLNTWKMSKQHHPYHHILALDTHFPASFCFFALCGGSFHLVSGW